MRHHQIHRLAKIIARKNHFKIIRLIYQSKYYALGKVRNAIYAGTYKGKPAILKVYDDPRLTDEPVSLKAFLRTNRSKLLIAPKLYAYEMNSPHTGWLVEERLQGGYFFKSPLTPGNRKIFLKLYLEYRKNFSTKPTRPLRLIEHLPAQELPLVRIRRWLELANNREALRILTGQKLLLDAKQFIPRYLKAIKLLRKEFLRRKMVWCHGHFKPKEIYYVPTKNIYYLTDFAHTHLFPEGYEFAFMIWADWLMAGNWGLTYKQWKKGVEAWVADIEPIAKTLRIKEYKQLIRASLVERIIGTILADIAATNRPVKESQARLKLLYRLLNKLL